MERPNVLIAGGAGYIGSLLAGELLRRGHRVTVLEALESGLIKDPFAPRYRNHHFIVN